MLNLPIGLEVGVDEAGRGCLWGPLYAAAVVISDDKKTWPKDFLEVADLIKDSKTVSAKKRKMIMTKIVRSGLIYGIGIVQHDEIDGHGASFANQLAFRRALDAIPSDKRSGAQIIIDGCLGLAEVKEGEACRTEIDGDAKFLSIATASIIAKESRDLWVTDWCSENPSTSEKYGFVTSKGYGTLVHRNAIKAHGLLEGHRRLYCRKIIPGLTVKRFDECKIID